MNDFIDSIYPEISHPKKTFEGHVFFQLAGRSRGRSGTFETFCLLRRSGAIRMFGRDDVERVFVDDVMLTRNGMENELHRGWTRSLVSVRLILCFLFSHLSFLFSVPS